MNINKKIITIVGTNASGKTSLGVHLANKFNGEIISADSRQVYRGMDIGSGKDLADYRVKGKKIPHHLIDIVSPKTEFNLSKYQKLAYKAIEEIWSRGKLPIIVGGTGLYAQAVVEGFELHKGKPDKKLREKLDKKSVKELFDQLEHLDPEKVKSLNESDRKNKRRLIRYIEITMNIGAELPVGSLAPYNTLLLGITHPKEVLHKRIYKRLMERLEKEDMIGEVKRLHKEGVSWKRLIDFGLEYKYTAMHLKGELGYDEMVEKLFISIRQFSKRQMTWLRRWERQGAKIHWVENKRETEKLVGEFTK